MSSGWDDRANTETRSIGDVLDALGIEAPLGEGELVDGALVLLKVLQADGSSRLSMSHSDGLGWIERSGMLRIAEQIELSTAQLGDGG